MAALNELQSVAAEAKRQLAQREHAIARKYVGGVPWFAVAWGLGNFAVWLALWPLVLLDILPLWAGFLIATVNVILCPRVGTRHFLKRARTCWRRLAIV